MSLKEQIDMVKDELSQEEKMFEGAVKAERFLTKYKKQLIAAGIAILVLVGANIGYSTYQENRITKANSTLNKLLEEHDEKLLNELKANSEKLYELYLFSYALKNSDMQTLQKLSTSKEAIISDIASYEEALSKKSADELGNYSMKPNAVMKDLAVLSEAMILMKKGDVKQARSRLDMISKDSTAANFATLLKHYGLTKE